MLVNCVCGKVFTLTDIELKEEKIKLTSFKRIHYTTPCCNTEHTVAYKDRYNNVKRVGVSNAK